MGQKYFEETPLDAVGYRRLKQDSSKESKENVNGGDEEIFLLPERMPQDSAL